MKKTITLALDDADLIELLRILMDKDAEAHKKEGHKQR